MTYTGLRLDFEAEIRMFCVKHLSAMLGAKRICLHYVCDGQLPRSGAPRSNAEIMFLLQRSQNYPKTEVTELCCVAHRAYHDTYST